MYKSRVPRNPPSNVKMTKKSDKSVSVADNKFRESKKKKTNSLKERMTHNKINVTTKPDSNLVHQIQVSDTDSSVTMGNDDDSIGLRSLSEILELSDDGNTCDSDDKKWLHMNFYRQEHMISTMEYCKGTKWLGVNSGSPSISGAVIRRCWLQFTSDLLVFSFLASLMLSYASCLYLA